MPRICFALAALLTACAGAHRESKQVVSASEYTTKDGVKTASEGHAAPKGKMVCDYEEPVGSHVPQRVCRYQPAPGENPGINSPIMGGASGGISNSQVPGTAPETVTTPGAGKFAPSAGVI